LTSAIATAGCAILISFAYRPIPLFTGRILAGFSYGVAFTTLSTRASTNPTLVQLSVFIGMFSTFFLRRSKWQLSIGLYCCLASALCAVLEDLMTNRLKVLKQFDSHVEVQKHPQNLKKFILARLIYLAQFLLPLNVVLLWVTGKEESLRIFEPFYDEDNFNYMISSIYAARNLTLFITSSTVHWNQSRNNQIFTGIISVFLVYGVFIFSSGNVSNVEKVVIVELIYQCLILKNFHPKAKCEGNFQVYLKIMSENLFHIFVVSLIMMQEKVYKTIFIAWCLTAAVVFIEVFRGFLLYEIPVKSVAALDVCAGVAVDVICDALPNMR
jgi:hypothetical protein